MVKWFIGLIFAALYLLVTFFGLGTVLLADGSRSERLNTLLIVILIYAAITFFLWLNVRRRK